MAFSSLYHKKIAIKIALNFQKMAIFQANNG